MAGLKVVAAVAVVGCWNRADFSEKKESERRNEEAGFPGIYQNKRLVSARDAAAVFPVISGGRFFVVCFCYFLAAASLTCRRSRR